MTGERIYVANLASQNDYNTLIATSDFKRGIEAINNCLENNVPVIIGVHHPASKSSANCKYGSCATYHFIVIVGRKINNGLTYYRYYDVGTSDSQKGMNENNLLLLDSVSSTLSGDSPNGQKYTLTQVRPTLIPKK